MIDWLLGVEEYDADIGRFFLGNLYAIANILLLYAGCSFKYTNEVVALIGSHRWVGEDKQAILCLTGVSMGHVGYGFCSTIKWLFGVNV